MEMETQSDWSVPVPENRYPNTTGTRYPGALTHLGVDHGDGDPVVAPEQATLGSEFTKLLVNAVIS